MNLGPVFAVAERQRGVLVGGQLRAGGISSKVERRLTEVCPVVSAPECPVRVAVEVDGWWSRRQSRRKLDDDNHKTNALMANDWRILRVTATMSDATVRRDVGRLLPAGLAAIRHG